MKNLKSILTLHASIATSATVGTIAFMAMPSLASTRETLTSQLGLSGQLGLWVPLATAVAVAHAIAYFLSVKKIARPFQKLATNATHCEQGFAFKTKSNTSEEDSIKHAIEANNLKTREAQQLAEELEGELEHLKSKLEAAESKIETLGAAKESAETTASELRVEFETMKASKVALEITLENERKTKIGAEVEKRTDEIYAQMERAVSAASLKSLWLPNFVQELKEPATVIKEISGGLRGNCDNTPLSRIAEQIEQIHQHSERQLSTLQAILDKQPPELAPDSRATEGDTETHSSALIPEAETEEPHADLDLEEEEAFEAQPREIGLSLKNEEPVEAVDETESVTSPYQVENVLGSIIEEFSPLAPDAHLSYTVDTDLDIEIEDASLISVMRCLTKAAVNSLGEGEITLGVELTTEHLIFDVACEGDLVFSDPACIDKASKEAEKLGGQVDLDRPSESELHFSFSYPLGSEETEAERSSDIIDVHSQFIGNEPLS